MAKYCPLLKQKVLYLDCLECEQHGKCKQLKNENKKEFVNEKNKKDSI